MPVSYKDYYALLGVERNADTQAIAKAFKRLARKYHPDLNPGDKRAEEKFKEINEAYEVLKDPKKRQLYDQLGPDWQHGQQFRDFGNFGNGTRFTFNGQNMGGTGFSDFFETLFGRGGQTFGNFGGGGSTFGNFGHGGSNPFGNFRQPGRDVEADLPLTLEEVQRGGPRGVTVTTPNGPRSLTVRIPAGVKDGAKLRLAGQGQAGPGGSGDMFLRVRYQPHDVFKVDGKDLVCDVDVAPWEAVLGGKMTVRTLDGEVKVTLPAGSSSGRKFRLRGLGLGPEGDRGDLFARVRIVVPSLLSDEERELWQQLADKAAATRG